ncbi:putative disease resistance RPP8-like protein 2 [Vitis vinifera]|uniref:Putative disease resistance RPP8-like protein 2 n=1 Tax=Vitis vinifera TaxID=29760 RepID=A0A438HEU4_VITVI|nr:putative disease resistance RPP8-like protein 2 [Vitis vinifera]
MWVAEGIISEAREETLEDIAEEYLDELIGRCMVQAGRVSSNGRVKTCRLHDLMQDLCSSKAKEENFLEIINLQEVETFSSSRVTTLAPNKVQRRAIYLDQSIHMESVNRNKGANSDVNLNVENGRMKWLRHLCLPQYLNMDDSKVQWDSLRNLETLKNFNAKQWAVKDLAHLAKLRKLKINNVKSFKELGVILKPSCPISNNLHSLVLDDVSSKIEETDLRQLSVCQHLYKLFLGGEINSLPGHHHFPPNLIKLTLWESHLKQDPVTILEKLLNLTTLHLKIDCYFGEEMVFSAHGFPRLKYLHVSYINYLRRLRVDKGAMPNLKSLTIVRCKSLEMVPEGLRYITTLQALEIKYMHKEFMERLQVINGKEGEDFYKVQHERISITILNKLKFELMPRKFAKRIQVINGEREDFYKVQLGAFHLITRPSHM